MLHSFNAQEAILYADKPTLSLYNSIVYIQVTGILVSSPDIQIQLFYLCFSLKILSECN